MQGTWYPVPVIFVILFKFLKLICTISIVFFTFEQSFMCFFQLQKSLRKVIFYKVFFKLDPDPQLKGSWIRIRI